MIGVIYWTGNGSTEEMANAVVEGIKAAGGEALLKNVEDITVDEALACSALALGCPAMGDEVLEESVFEPWFTDLEGKLSGKKVGLFGSYGWGTGVWMENWEARCKDAGVTVVSTVIAQGAPDDDAVASLHELAKGLA